MPLLVGPFFVEALFADLSFGRGSRPLDDLEDLFLRGSLFAVLCLTPDVTARRKSSSFIHGDSSGIQYISDAFSVSW